MELRRILVPLDGSARAMAVLPLVQVFAETSGASVHLLGVLDPQHPEWEGGELRPLACEQPHRQLTAAAERLRARGIAVNVLLRPGKPAETITALAEELDADLLALATRGRGGFTRLLLGSVADAVVRRSSKPVLLVSPLEADEHARSVTLRRVLLPLDGSSFAEQAVPLAGTVAHLLDAELVLARVEPFGPVWPYGVAPDAEGALEQLTGRAAQRYLEQAQQRLPVKVVSSAVVLRGAPQAMLTTFVGQNDVGLVVMATHGRSGLGRLVIGSVADAIIRTGTPTLLLPPAAARTAWSPLAGDDTADGTRANALASELQEDIPNASGGGSRW
ncbi:MAG TPA: universal stress protein [Dehalococcoidia bacterium]|nr:universal stress protein [Dehalococcoidia bacterium]